MLRNVSVQKAYVHSQVCPSMWYNHYHKQKMFFMGQSLLLSLPHLLVCCPIHVSTEGETVASCSDLPNSMWGALMRHEQGGWREEET